MTDFTASTHCYLAFDGGLYCSANFQGRVDAYQWVGPGEFAAAITGFCEAAGFRSWSSVEAVLPFFTGTYLSCRFGAVEIPPRGCFVFEATLGAAFRGLAAQPHVAKALAVEVCN